MLVIVNFAISSFPVDLLLLFEEVRSGLLHWPYKEPSLYSSIARFGDSEISHDKVTEMEFSIRMILIMITYSHQNKEI